MTEGELSCGKDGALSMVATSILTETKLLSGNTSNKASETNEVMTVSRWCQETSPTCQVGLLS